MLKDIAYYKTGGHCKNLHQPHSAQELRDITRSLHKTRTPYFVIGGGSNSLVLDDDYPGDVISLANINQITFDGKRVTVGAGLDNSSLSQAAYKEGLAGVSWMNGLPGQLGGTVRMNARCYGGEISQVVQSVGVVTGDGEIVTYENNGQLFKGYKDTIFMESQDIIYQVTMGLSPGRAEDIKSHMDFCKADRISKNQFLYPSCGCVFKNDYRVGVPSGMLLDRAGAHSLSTHQVRLNPKHANFVFNCGASSRQILEVTFAMRDLVYRHYGVWLAYEMEILGQLPQDLAAKVLEARPQNFNEVALKPLREAFGKK